MLFERSLKQNRAARRLALLAASTAALSLAACASPEQKLERYTESGQEFLEKEQYGRASVQFRNALKIEENHIPAIRGLATIAEERNDFRAMFGLLQRVARLDPNDVDARAQMAKIYLIGGDEAAALETIDAALEIAPDNAEAIAVRAAVMFRLENREEALALAERALELDPATPEAATILATDMIQAKDYDAAVALLDRTIDAGADSAVLHLLKVQIFTDQGRADDVEASYEALIEAFPDETAYRRLYAARLIADEKVDAARTQLMRVVELEPDGVNAYLDLVRLDYRSGGADAADARFRAFLEETPDNIELKFAYGAFLIQQTRADDARAHFGRLADGDADDPTVLRAKNELAKLALADQDVDGVRTLVAEILEVDARNSDALMKRASLMILDNEPDEAINTLRIVLADAPESAAAKMLTAAAYEKKGEIITAANEFTRALDDSQRKTDVAPVFARFLLRNGDAERAARVLAEAVDVDPDHQPSLKLLAAVRLQQRDWRGAEEAGRLLSEASTDDDDVVGRILGTAYAGLGDYAGAIEALSEANDRTPLARRPLATLVGAYLANDQASDAERVLRDTISRDPEAYEARLLLARVIGDEGGAGRPEDAARVLREAIDLAPERAEAYELLHLALRRAGQTAEASAVLDEGAVRATRKDGVLVLKADLLLSEGRLDDALNIYQDILSRRPNDLIVANNFAALVAELRDDEASLRAAAAAAEPLKNSDNASFLDTYGWVQVRAGDLETGVAALERAVAADPTLSEARYHLGVALTKAGDKQAARPHLEAAAAATGLAPEKVEKARALLRD